MYDGYASSRFVPDARTGVLASSWYDVADTSSAEPDTGSLQDNAVGSAHSLPNWTGTTSSQPTGTNLTGSFLSGTRYSATSRFAAAGEAGSARTIASADNA